MSLYQKETNKWWILDWRANEVIKRIPNEKMILAKPVVRHGEKPSIMQREAVV